MRTRELLGPVAAAMLAVFTLTSCSWLRPPADGNRTTRLEMRLVETPEDRGERGYTWIDPQTGKALGTSQHMKTPPTVIRLAGAQELGSRDEGHAHGRQHNTQGGARPHLWRPRARLRVREQTHFHQHQEEGRGRP